MSQEIIKESNMFFIMLLLGFLLSLSYNCLQILRYLIKHNKWLIDGEDILFWTIWGAVLVENIYLKRYYVMRIYYILALLTGIFLCKKIISKHVVICISSWVKRMLKKLTIPLKKDKIK